jgi:predicted transport protein
MFAFTAFAGTIAQKRSVIIWRCQNKFVSLQPSKKTYKIQITIKYEAEQTFQGFIRVDNHAFGLYQHAGARAVRRTE